MFAKVSTNLIRVKQPKLKTKCQRRKFSMFGYTIKKNIIGFEYTKENTTFTEVVDKELIKVQQETFDSINLESLKYDRNVRINSELINEFSKKYSKFLTDKQLQTFSELEQLNSVSAHKELYLEDYENITKVMEECNKYLETGKYKPEIYTNYTYRDKVSALSQCIVMGSIEQEQNFRRSLEKLRLHDNKILSYNVFFAAHCINILRNLKTNRKLLLDLSWFLTQHNHVFKYNNDLIVHKSLKYAQRRVILDCILDCIYAFIRGIVVGMFLIFIGVIDYLFINIIL